MELGPYLERLMTQMEHVLDADDPDLREVWITSSFFFLTLEPRVE